MGERFQFYVLTKKPKKFSFSEDEPERITAIHDQWVWGMAALKYANHLVSILKKTNFEDFESSNVGDYIQSILKVRWDTASGLNFYHRVSIEEMDYTPKRADTNYGCVIIDARDQKDIKAAFYDEEGKYMPYIDWVLHCHKNETKYDEAETKKKMPIVIDNVFDRLDQQFFEDLCASMWNIYEEEHKVQLEETRKEEVAMMERKLNLAKAKAYSNTSLKRPLTDEEFKEYKDVMSQLGVELN